MNQKENADSKTIQISSGGTMIEHRTNSDRWEIILREKVLDSGKVLFPRRIKIDTASISQGENPILFAYELVKIAEHIKLLSSNPALVHLPEWMFGAENPEPINACKDKKDALPDSINDGGEKE